MPWADRSSRRNVLAMSVALWSATTALCGMAVNFTMLFGALMFMAAVFSGPSFAMTQALATVRMRERLTHA